MLDDSNFYTTFYTKTDADAKYQPIGSYALSSSLASYAPLNNPTFTGTVQAPTPTTTDNNTNVATTAYVQSNLTTYGKKLWVCGYVSAGQTGGTTVANNFGVSAATVSSSAGVYSITFGTAAPNSVYSCFASIQGVNPGFISVQGSSTTLCRIYTFDKTGTASSSFAFYFQIFAQ